MAWSCAPKIRARNPPSPRSGSSPLTSWSVATGAEADDRARRGVSRAGAPGRALAAAVARVAGARRVECAGPLSRIAWPPTVGVDRTRSVPVRERTDRALAGRPLDPPRAADRDSAVAARGVCLLTAARPAAPGDALRPAGARLTPAGARDLHAAGHGALGHRARGPDSFGNPAHD